jgi:hypothetical protein
VQLVKSLGETKELLQIGTDLIHFQRLILRTMILPEFSEIAPLSPLKYDEVFSSPLKSRDKADQMGIVQREDLMKSFCFQAPCLLNTIIWFINSLKLLQSHSNFFGSFAHLSL